jgi:hypothetical protein
LYFRSSSSRMIRLVSLRNVQGTKAPKHQNRHP